MLSGLGQGIAQFGATMSALERERERLEEARALKREELAARMADRALERESKMTMKEMEIEGRTANTQAAGAAARATAEATHGVQPSEDQVIRRLMLENGWSREEAAQAYRADPVRMGIGPTLEEPETSIVDRKGSAERGSKVIKAEQDQLRFNRPGYADQFAKSEEGMQGVRLREEMLKGTADPGKVSDAYLAASDKGRFSMDGGSVLKKSTGDTATTEVGEAEAAKDRAAAAADAPGSAKNYRADLGLISERRKNLDNEINTQRNLMKEAVANTYSKDGKNKIIADYTASIKELEKRRGELDRQMDELQARISGQRAGPAAPARTGGTLPPTAKGVSNAWQQYQQMKGR
jgi:hypothetical protein